MNYTVNESALKFLPHGMALFLALSAPRENISVILQRNPGEFVVDRSVTKESCCQRKQCETRNAGHGSVLLENTVSSL